MQERIGRAFTHTREMELRHFLYEAALNGYGSPQAQIQERADGSTLITYKREAGRATISASVGSRFSECRRCATKAWCVLRCITTER